MITTYAELQSAVTSWTNRTDLASVIPDFISLAEAVIKRDLRTMGEEKRAFATLTAGEETVALPDDFNGMRSLFLRGDPRRALNQVSLDKLRRSYAGSVTGKPEMFAVGDGVLFFGYVPDSDYVVEMNYYAFSPLSDSNTTNAVLTSHPDLYLRLALAEAHRYMFDPEATAYWEALAAQSMAQAKASDKRVRYGAVPMRAFAQQSS